MQEKINATYLFEETGHIWSVCINTCSATGKTQLVVKEMCLQGFCLKVMLTKHENKLTDWFTSDLLNIKTYCILRLQLKLLPMLA